MPHDTRSPSRLESHHYHCQCKKCGSPFSLHIYYTITDVKIILLQYNYCTKYFTKCIEKYKDQCKDANLKYLTRMQIVHFGRVHNKEFQRDSQELF